MLLHQPTYMSQIHGSGNGLILFMGERIEHAITSIQKYVPEVVYIITSDKYEAKHRRRLKDWSKQYGFREGGVNSVADLFEPSAVISLVNEVVSIQAQEKELYGEDEEYLWQIGITGGTMHMAAAGTYAGVLLNSRIFYVIQPPEGGKPMPNRDVFEFPQMLGISIVLSMPMNVLAFINQGSGLIHEIFENRLMPPGMFDYLCKIGILFSDNEKWFLTEEGKASINIVKNTPIAKELLDLKIGKHADNDDQFLGWA